MTDNIATPNALVCQAVYLLQGLRECYRCKKQTRMFAMMALPPFGFEGKQDQVLDDDGPMLSNITNMPANLVQAMRPVAGSILREDYSRMAGLSYWMNHCEHCDATQGDHYVHGPDGPFYPWEAADDERIEVRRLEGPFRLADASTAYSGAMADWRDRRHGVPLVLVPVRKARKPRARKPVAGK